MSLRLQTLILSLLLVAAPCTSQAFSVRPSLIDLQVDAGKIVESHFTIVNTDAQPQTYFLSAMAFSPKDESGSPVFDSSDRSGVAAWVRFPSPSVVVPGVSKVEATFDVDVPSGTKFGGYYAAVLVSPTTADVVAAQSGAHVEAKIAVLTFIKVGSGGVEKVGLLDVSLTDKRWFHDGLWGEFSYRLQNQGDVHVIPSGTVTLRDVFGRIIARGTLNVAGERLLPGTTRTFVQSLPTDPPRSFVDGVAKQAATFALGPVTLQLDISPGLTPEQTNHATARLWIIPWQLLISVLVSVGLLYGLMKVLMRSRKK